MGLRFRLRFRVGRAAPACGCFCPVISDALVFSCTEEFLTIRPVLWLG